MTRVFESRDGSIWLVTSLGLVRRAEDGRTMLYRAPKPMPMGNFLTSIFEDAGGRIWVGSRQGIYVLRPLPLSDPAAFEPHTLEGARRASSPSDLPAREGDAVEFLSVDWLDGNVIQAMHEGADGRVWITTKASLIVFDGREFRIFGAANGLNSAIGMMAEDADGNLWMATLNGAYKLVTHGLTTYGIDEGLGGRTVMSVYQNASGELYVVNGDWKVSRLDGRRFVTAGPPLGEMGGPIWTSNVAFLDSVGSWWFMTERRLLRYDNVRGVEELKTRSPSFVFQTGEQFHNGGFYKLFEDSRGRVWISSRATEAARMGLSVWDRRTNSLHVFGAAEDFPEGRAASAFCEDGAGGIWLGFYYGDLARYRDGRFTLFTSKDGLPEGFVTAIYRDGAGRIWIAQNGGGLSRVDDPSAERPTFVKYTTANGLSSDNVCAITEDNQGRIYVGTVRGIDRVSPDTGRVKHYSMAEGLADDFVTVAFRDRLGALWFGTQNGLSRLVPEPEAQAGAPPILVGALRVAGVHWQMTVAPQLEGRRLTPEQRRALYLIFKEAINNVARHSACERASCHITLEHNTLVAAIEDDGRGIESGLGGSGRGGRGLSNMRERAAGMGGQLSVSPREGGGTRLVLTLPLRPGSMNMFARVGRG